MGFVAGGDSGTLAHVSVHQRFLSEVVGMSVRSLFRFRLRTLLILMMLAALGLAPLGQAGREYRAEQVALKRLIGNDLHTGGRVEFLHHPPFT